MEDDRSYAIAPDSQEHKCPYCASVFEYLKLGTRTYCPNCGKDLKLRGYPGVPKEPA